MLLIIVFASPLPQKNMRRTAPFTFDRLPLHAIFWLVLLDTAVIFSPDLSIYVCLSADFRRCKAPDNRLTRGVA